MIAFNQRGECHMSIKKCVTSHTLRKAISRTTAMANREKPNKWSVPSQYEPTVRTISTPPTSSAVAVSPDACFSLIITSVHQVEERKQDEPQQIDEVPVTRRGYKQLAVPRADESGGDPLTC